MLQHLSELPTLWDTLSSSPLPLILYGTGDGADKILSALTAHGLSVDRIMVSDDFNRGQSFHGQPVTTLAALEAEYEDFVILVAFGSHLPVLHARIEDYARRHPLYVPDVPVCGGSLFDSAFVEAHTEELEAAYTLLADEASRRVFEQVLEYKLTGSLSALCAMESPKEEVFRELLVLGPQEHYLDLGAYRGDTIEEFCRLVQGSYASVTALEPDPYTFRKLSEAYSRPGMKLLPYAAGEAPGELYLLRRRGRGSTLLRTPPAGSAARSIPMVSVDSLAQPVTYLKMDLEGFEEAALIGARKTLAEQAPKLNIACYHRSEDLFRLPLLLHRLQPRYRLYLRRHPCIPCWDLNLYATAN